MAVEIFDREACMHCGNCFEVCPMQAIDYGSWTEARIEIDADACIECGECVDACPNGVLSL